MSKWKEIKSYLPEVFSSGMISKLKKSYEPLRLKKMSLKKMRFKTWVLWTRLIKIKKMHTII